jgi:hypothetical protein
MVKGGGVVAGSVARSSIASNWPLRGCLPLGCGHAPLRHPRQFLAWSAWMGNCGQNQSSSTFPMSADFWAGYLSGAAGILIGNPLDLIKTRIQAGPPASPSLNPTSPRPQTFKGHFDHAGTLVRGALQLPIRDIFCAAPPIPMLSHDTAV